MQPYEVHVLLTATGKFFKFSNLGHVAISDRASYKSGMDIGRDKQK